MKDYPPREQNVPIMDGAADATPAEKREGLHDQTAYDHPGDPRGAEQDQALREHEAGLDAGIGAGEDEESGIGEQRADEGDAAIRSSAEVESDPDSAT
ncbi:hypothetical protein GCM10027515_04260 [Schumannella luteola]|uniref:Uncharacterized protein n=1 Tax=Schumannella luteola TaxID=472059 RepID=A0A852YHA2_9MICO|nr:hypothetical protein [Schumannella luteola]NYG98438.1 hypothetical protein [Schumannella luteola]TPX01329.1 hypothetical protein FJ656_28500 [Schumannella luteola]